MLTNIIFFFLTTLDFFLIKNFILLITFFQLCSGLFDLNFYHFNRRWVLLGLKALL